MNRILCCTLLCLGCSETEGPSTALDLGLPADASTDVGALDGAPDAGLPSDLATATTPRLLVTTSLEFQSEVEFAVALTGPTTEPLTVTIAVDREEFLVETPSLSFDGSNWDVPQVVAIRLDTDTHCFSGSTHGAATVSIDGHPESSRNVELTATSHYDPTFSVNPTGIAAIAGQLDGTFQVTAAGCIPPGGTVTVPVTVSDQFIAVQPTELVFAEGLLQQTVTVEALQDGCPHPLRMATVVLGAATGGGFDGVDPDDVSVTSVDGSDPLPPAVTPTALTTSETGTSASFDVAVGATPRGCIAAGGWIEVTATGIPPDEGRIDPTTVRFDATNGFDAQTFTVTGVDDTRCDGSQTYSIGLTMTSSDPIWDGFTVPNVSVTNTDDDSAGVLVTPTQVSVPEAGSQPVEVSLTCAPGETVDVSFVSTRPSEADVSPAVLSFDNSNYAVPQQVTISGVDESIADGDQVLAIVTTMNATLVYQGGAVPDVTVMVIDDD